MTKLELASRTLGRGVLRVAVAASSHVRHAQAVVAGCVLVLVYVGLFGIYRPFNIDDSWFPSFSRNLWVHQLEPDVTFGGVFPEGMGGTVAFGKIPAWIQGALLSALGWQLESVHFATLATFLLSCGLLFVFVRGRGYSHEKALWCTLLLALIEPFVALANQGKYEFVTFTFSIAALVLHQRGRLVWAGLIAALAFECQPIGVVAGIYVLCAELEPLAQRRFGVRWRRLLELGLGASIGALVYVYLHPVWLEQLASLTAAGPDPEPWFQRHFLYPYFFTAKYLRHLPELGVILLALGLHIARWGAGGLTWRRALTFPLLAMLATLLLGLVVGHANYHYAVFFMLPAYLFVFDTLSSRTKPELLFMVAAAAMIPQYAFVFHLNGKYRNREYLQVLYDVVHTGADLADPPRSVVVYGHYNTYFAFLDDTFLHDQRLLNEAPSSQRRFLVCEMGVRAVDGTTRKTCTGLLPSFGPARLVDTVDYGSTTFGVFVALPRALAEGQRPEHGRSTAHR